MMYRLFRISAFIICLFLLHFAISRDMDKFVEEMKRMQKDIEKKYKHLMEKDEHGYYIKVSKEQAKFVFSYIDQDRNNFVDRDELIKFGKLTVSNNTESAEIWADTALLDDKNGNNMMSFTVHLFSMASDTARAQMNGINTKMVICIKMIQ